MSEPKSPLAELAEFVSAATIEYRKGDEVEVKGGAVHITPARVGATGPEADQLAGSGFVMAGPAAALLAAVA